jgi:hypothetical protein
MLRIDRETKELTKLQKLGLPDAGLTERRDLQQMIRNSPEAFFEEMGEPLLLIGEEVRPTDFVEDRFDLLAIDQQGAAVVIELKRGTHKLHLLQALSYAAMVSKWETNEFISQRERLVGKSHEEVEEEIEQFLLEDIGSLNDSQRVLLFAEDFDYEVLATSEWLSEVYEADIRCYRLVLSVEDKAEFLTCTCIYPPPEITQHAVRRKRRGRPSDMRWPTWDEALEDIENAAVADFFRDELAAKKCEGYLRKRTIRYRLQGHRRFSVTARRKFAYVWQAGRFAEDEEFWRKQLGNHIDAKPVKQGRCLRFFLSKPADFSGFTDALSKDLHFVEEDALPSSEND